MLEKLVYIENNGIDSDGKISYSFYFSDKGVSASTLEEMRSNVRGIFFDTDSIQKNKLKKFDIQTDKILSLIQENPSLGYRHALYGIVSICWHNIDNEDEYPEDGRLFLNYGESLNDVDSKLYAVGIRHKDLQ